MLDQVEGEQHCLMALGLLRSAWNYRGSEAAKNRHRAGHGGGFSTLHIGVNDVFDRCRHGACSSLLAHPIVANANVPSVAT
jgi:hypothetical protein